MTNFDELMEAVKTLPPQTVAVAAANSEPAVLGAVEAAEKGVAVAILFGDERRIRDIAGARCVDLCNCQIVHEPDELQAAAKAVQAVREGKAQVLVKGHIHTDDFLRAVLDKDYGLRSGYLMSHVFILEARQLGRLLFVTDGAMNIAPDLEQKAQIILNAVYLARLFGVRQPKVGILAAVELVNPKMQATLDAAALAAMDRRGQFPFCVVDGPFALDNAVSEEAARIKAIKGPVAGRCDILLVPDIEAGNILVKTFSFLCGGRTAGILIGAAAPVVLTSRADPPEARLHSIAAAALVAGLQRTARIKIGRVHY
ncbi:MAG: bifunctional enoyl-CoA hydratase/phosphate acetyltransferase [Armatimonadetes bacterium]|nr:bifunctional enoyl-CoA hydratase/phosphate acetyltransferase [Armatimonadota bacterium]